MAHVMAPAGVCGGAGASRPRRGVLAGKRGAVEGLPLRGGERQCPCAGGRRVARLKLKKSGLGGQAGRSGASAMPPRRNTARAAALGGVESLAGDPSLIGEHLQGLVTIANVAFLLYFLKQQRSLSGSRRGSAPWLPGGVAWLLPKASDFGKGVGVAAAAGEPAAPAPAPSEWTASLGDEKELEEHAEEDAATSPVPSSDEVWAQVRLHLAGPGSGANGGNGGDGEAGEESASEAPARSSSAASAPPRKARSEAPKLILQCLKPAERRALLNISLEALKSRLAALELSRGEAGGGARFKALCSGILNSCVEEAALKWLGYSPNVTQITFGASEGPGGDGGGGGGAAEQAQAWTVLNLMQDDKWFLYTSVFYFLARGEASYVEESKLGESKGWVSSAVLIAGNASHILEDCVVMIAEAVADAYLEEVCQGNTRSFSGLAAGEKSSDFPAAAALKAVMIHPVLDSARKIQVRPFRHHHRHYRHRHHHHHHPVNSLTHSLACCVRSCLLLSWLCSSAFAEGEEPIGSVPPPLPVLPLRATHL